MPNGAPPEDGHDGQGVVSYVNRDGVAYLTLNRPAKLNALNTQLVIGIRRALQRFDRDDEAAVAVMHGAGRAFSAGADMDEARARDDGVSGMWADAIRPRDLYHGFVHWKPVIAAVHGYALGGGLALALRADAFVVTRSAQMQVTEISRGLPAGGLWALMHFRGAGTFADDVTLTGRFFTGDEAERAGVVTLATADDEVLAAADAHARRIQAMPADSVRSAVRVRRWYMQEAERQAGFLAEPRSTLEISRSPEGRATSGKVHPPDDV